MSFILHCSKKKTRAARKLSINCDTTFLALALLGLPRACHVFFTFIFFFKSCEVAPSFLFFLNNKLWKNTGLSLLHTDFKFYDKSYAHDKMHIMCLIITVKSTQLTVCGWYLKSNVSISWVCGGKRQLSVKSDGDDRWPSSPQFADVTLWERQTEEDSY